MKYTVKWLEDNLGITRKTIRNYEAKGLISADSSRNPINNYREYDDKDIDRIWSIKILQGVGYSLSEIRELIENQDADIHKSISDKVAELEKKRDEISSCIEFAKTIKLTGRIPTTKKIGSVSFLEFMDYSRENWNIYVEPKAAAYIEGMESIQNMKVEEFAECDIDRLEAIADLMRGYQEMQRGCTINSYFQILANMQISDFKSEFVQMTVQQLYLFLANEEVASEKGEKFTPAFFAKYTVPFFLEGSDIGKINIATYGLEGSEFIANAIAFFGGFASLDDLD